MAKRKTEYRANIGTSSLILIFIVLCLVAFGMLSLSSAQNEWNLAERNAAAVTGYYAADRDGEEFYRMVCEAVGKAAGETDEQKRRELFIHAMDGYYSGADDTVCIQVPMERAQALFIELLPDFGNGGQVKILQWKVISTEDYEIDTSMPVWTGEEGNH